MPAAKYDFTSSGCQGPPLEMGATFSNQLVWQKFDPALTAAAQAIADFAAASRGMIADPVERIFTPVDITGYTVKMQVRQKIGSPVILEISTANGRVTLIPLSGIINLQVAASDTASLPPGLYRYDLDLTDTNGFVTKFIEGSFEIRGSITVNG